MVRLPEDVVRALRLRAASSDITIAEAARQLMLPKDVGHPLGLEEHVVWLHDRLLKRRNDLVGVFEDAGIDTSSVDQAIDALFRLHSAWPDDDDGFDYASLYGAGVVP